MMYLLNHMYMSLINKLKNKMENAMNIPFKSMVDMVSLIN